jgi:hypothetical protein
MKYALKIQGVGGNFIARRTVCGKTEFFEVTNSDDALQRAESTLKRILWEYRDNRLFRWCYRLDIVPITT